jgi:hypothetical protein
MLTFQEAHSHQKLCDISGAEPVLCLEEHVMFPSEQDGELVYRCLICKQVTHIGLDLETRIREDLKTMNSSLADL